MDEKFLSRTMHESDVTNQRANTRDVNDQGEEVDVQRGEHAKLTVHTVNQTACLK